MKCYKCGTEYSGNVCPNCGAQKLKIKHYPEYKKPGIAFYAFIAIVIILALKCIVNNSSSDADTVSKAVSDTASSTPIAYVYCDITEMLNELDDNALKAESDYNNRYIEITGTLNVIDSDGKYISVEPLSGDTLFSLSDNIRCDIKNSDQINRIMKMHRGDIITIKGKITDVGEVLGYAMDIDDIK